jgi:hypothetical protein
VLLCAQLRVNVAALLFPFQPVHVEGVRLFVCAIKQTDADRIARVSLQDRRDGVAMDDRGEGVGRLVSGPDTEEQRLVAVVDTEYAWIVHRAGEVRRVDRLVEPVEQKAPVMNKQSEIAVVGDERVGDSHLCAMVDLLAAAGVEETREARLNDDPAEETVLLVRVGEQMVMEEGSLQLDIGIPLVANRLAGQHACVIVPADVRTVCNQHVEFYKMDMHPDFVGAGNELEGRPVEHARQAVRVVDADAGARLGLEDEWFRRSAARQHVVEVFVHDVQTSDRVVPAFFVVDQRHLDHGDVELLDDRVADAGVDEDRAGSGIGDGGVLFQHGHLPAAD